MLDWLRYIIIASALLLTLAAYIDFRGGHRPRVVSSVLAAFVTIAVVVQAVIAVIALVRGAPTTETATFIGYLATTTIMVPAAWYVVRIEPSKWASLALCVSGFVIAVLEVRLEQLWTR